MLVKALQRRVESLEHQLRAQELPMDVVQARVAFEELIRNKGEIELAEMVVSLERMNNNLWALLEARHDAC